MTSEIANGVKILTEVMADFRDVKTVDSLPKLLERSTHAVARIFGEESQHVSRLQALVNSIDFSKLEDYVSITNKGKVTHLRIDGWEQYRASILGILQIMIDDLRLSTHGSGETMTRIFISYRRVDTSGHAGRVYDRLEQHFGANLIFFDVDSIPPGVDFIEAIERAVTSCQLLLAVIGRQWVGTSDPNGGRRLDNPKDFVRLEIATALKRNIRVIPVLVDGASMPQESDLPDELKSLVRRNAVRINHESFRSDVDRLIAAIERNPGTPSTNDPAPRARSIPMPAVTQSVGAKQKADFLVQSYEIIKSYFQDALPQLENASGGIEVAFREVNNLKFACEIFVHGSSKVRCKIWLGTGSMSREMVIGYVEGHFDLNNDNSYNEMISVETNGSQMYLRIPMADILPIGGVVPPDMPDADDAAELLWRRFISWL